MSAWVPREFKEAIEVLAAVAQMSQSELIREGLASVATQAADPCPEEGGDG